VKQDHKISRGNAAGGSRSGPFTKIIQLADGSQSFPKHLRLLSLWFYNASWIKITAFHKFPGRINRNLLQGKLTVVNKRRSYAPTANYKDSSPYTVLPAMLIVYRSVDHLKHSYHFNTNEYEKKITINPKHVDRCVVAACTGNTT
jgi:hypothetical protein